MFDYLDKKHYIMEDIKTMHFYEIKRELNLETLARFIEQHPELKEFVELVMQFDVWKEDSEKPTGNIKIEFGKSKPDKFIVRLGAILDKPEIHIDIYRGNPMLTFHDNRADYTTIGCSINLALIKNFTVVNYDRNDLIYREYTFSYDKIGDYRFIVKIEK